MDLENLTPEQIRRGFVEENGSYRCLACGESFHPGEVYPIGGRFYEPRRAAEVHQQTEHPDWVLSLLRDDSKYNTLTENQARLLELFAGGLPDKDIAAALGLSVSTVRHQKFMFREKAKTAKLYLAIYEGVFREGGDIMPVHQHARQVDDRFVITAAERDKVLATFFESLNPPRLKAFPPKEKKKVIILNRIIEQFEAGRTYTEKEVNETLKEIYPDFATLRRYMIEYGYMKRTRDCASYWLT